MPWFIGLQLCFYCSGGKRLQPFSTASAALSLFVLFLSCLLFPFFFLLSFHLTTSSCNLSFFQLYVNVFFILATVAHFPPQVQPYRPFIVLLSVSAFKCSPIQSIQQVLFSICSPPQLPHSRAQLADSNLSMSLWLPTLSLFPCRSPRQRHPLVSSLGGHWEKLARGSDNLRPLICHLLREKHPPNCGGGALRGWGAGIEVVIVVSGGSEVKRGRSHRWLASFMCRSGGKQGQEGCLLGSWGVK